MKIMRHAIAISTILLLSACSMTVRNNVSSFHKMAAPNGEAVAIIPMSLSQDPESLEFQEYSNLVRKQLTMLGYTVANVDEADLIAELGYNVKRDRKKHISAFSGRYGFFDPWYSSGYYNWYHWRRSAFLFSHYYDPFYSPRGVHNMNRTEHMRKLMLDIRKSGGEKIFEGRVESIGQSRSLPKVLPYMIEAMFTSFPGNSGEVKQIIIREEQDK